MRRDPQSRPEWDQWVAVAGEWDMEAGTIRNASLNAWLPRTPARPPHVLMLVPLDNIEGLSWTYRGRAEFPDDVDIPYRQTAKPEWPTFVAETKFDLLEVLREAVPFSWPRIQHDWWYAGDVVSDPATGRTHRPRLPVIEDMAMEGEWPRAPRTLAALRRALGTVPRRVERGRLVEVGPAERIWAHWRQLARAQLLDLFGSDPLTAREVRDTGGFISEAALDPWGLRSVVPPELRRHHGLVGPLVPIQGVPPRYNPAWRDPLQGGLADGRRPSDFPRRALQQGIKVELEHTRDRRIATKIAMDHLTEDPHYYERLARCMPEH